MLKTVFQITAKSKKGETIAETIIALTILAMGIAMTSTLMANSLRNVNTSKYRVIAVNIAREGIEAVRNIRDTNWLKFSSKRRMCWNHMPQPLAEDDCNDTPTLITPGNYIVYKDVDERWRLKLIPGAPTFDLTQLYLVDIDPTIDTDKDGNLTNDNDIYNHKTSDVPTDDDALGKDHAEKSIYKRIIRIDYLKNDGTLVTSGAPSDEVNRMVVTSTVSWLSAGNENKVELKTHLTDYLGRENLAN